jgi:hypothetical protein
MVQVTTSESKRTTSNNNKFEKKLFIGFDKINIDSFFLH